MQRKSGFTLIELLVTITIISLLASIIYVSFGESRDNARNKAMIVELKEVQLAIETYRGQHDSFPAPANAPCGGTDADGDLIASDSGCPGLYIDGLVPEFIDALPSATDSANAACDIEYQTDVDRSWFRITAANCLAGVDATSGVAYGNPLARCPIGSDQSVPPCDPSQPDFYESFVVYSLGGANEGSSVASVAYTWNTGSWSGCSGACGTTGSQTRSVSCQNSSGTTVADSNCSSAMPATSQSCTNPACSFTDCNLDGVTVAHGDSRVFYAYSSSMCFWNGLRTCNDGSLDGWSFYSNASCS